MITETFMSCGVNYTIRIGQNKNENWKLLDISEPDNIWFHLADAPSPYVVLATNKDICEIPKNVLYRCAILCKTRSSSKKENNSLINYTYIRNVHKGTHTGEAIIEKNKVLRV